MVEYTNLTDPPKLGSLDKNDMLSLVYNEVVAHIARLKESGRIPEGMDLNAEAIVSQMMLESGWASSPLSNNANNFGGLTTGKAWKGEYVTVDKDPFTGKTYHYRKYKTPLEGIRAQVEFYLPDVNPIYAKAGVLKAKTPQEHFARVKAAGYAEDADYVSKLSSFLNSTIRPRLKRGGNQENINNWMKEQGAYDAGENYVQELQQEEIASQTPTGNMYPFMSQMASSPQVKPKDLFGDIDTTPIKRNYISENNVADAKTFVPSEEQAEAEAEKQAAALKRQAQLEKYLATPVTSSNTPTFGQGSMFGQGQLFGASKKRAGGSNVGKYPNVKSFAGPSGGAPAGSYPINTIERGRSALKLAHHAPNPSGIKQAVYRKYPSLKKSNGGPIGPIRPIPGLLEQMMENYYMGLSPEEAEKLRESAINYQDILQAKQGEVAQEEEYVTGVQQRMAEIARERSEPGTPYEEDYEYLGIPFMADETSWFHKLKDPKTGEPMIPYSCQGVACAIGRKAGATAAQDYRGVQAGDPWRVITGSRTVDNPDVLAGMGLYPIESLGEDAKLQPGDMMRMGYPTGGTYHNVIAITPEEWENYDDFQAGYASEWYKGVKRGPWTYDPEASTAFRYLRNLPKLQEELKTLEEDSSPIKQYEAYKKANLPQRLELQKPGQLSSVGPTKLINTEPAKTKRKLFRNR